MTMHRAQALLALLSATAIAGSGLAISAPALAQSHTEIGNDMNRCAPGHGAALLVTVDAIKSATGTVRLQSYRATDEDWLVKGHWLSRIQLRARAGTMNFCVPLPGPGVYGIAVRHDANDNGKTDITTDGGAMSNNPSFSIFNLGRPSYTKVGVQVGQGVTPIRITMKYL